MGRVFTYSDIEHGMVPKPEDFRNARDSFTELIEGKIKSNDVDGSIIFGSCAIGTQGARSDFDCLISLTGSELRNYQAFQSIRHQFEVATAHRIPFEAITYPRPALEKGYHDIDRYFGEHLRGTCRIVLGEQDPSSYIRFYGAKSAKDILAGYLFNKRRKLTSTIKAGHPLEVKDGGLQRMLELPNAIGRRALQAMSEVGLIKDTAPEGADKSTIAAQAEAMFGKYGIRDGYELLFAENMAYTRLLSETCNGRLTSSEYEGELRRLFSVLPKAVIWVGQVQDTLLPLFDQIEYKPEMTD